MTMIEEKRKQPRYPCVGIKLVYSPFDKANMTDLGTRFIQAISHDLSLHGLSFDVSEPLEEDTELVVIIQTEEDNTREQHMLTRVQWCRQLGNEHYRVGLNITGYQDIDTGQIRVLHPVSTQSFLPSEVRMCCPACGHTGKFSLIGSQEMINNKGVIPLYDCEACGTTRTLISLLEHNRKVDD